MYFEFSHLNIGINDIDIINTGHFTGGILRVPKLRTRKHPEAI